MINSQSEICDMKWITYLSMIIVLFTGSDILGQVEFEQMIRLKNIETNATSDSVIVIQPEGTLAIRNSATLFQHQVLSIAGDTLILSDGGFVILPGTARDDGDTSAENELQDFIVSDYGDTLTITNGSSIIIPGLSAAQSIPANRLLGGAADEFAANIDIVTDGSYLILANSSSSRSGDVSDDTYGNSDIWITKVTARGDTLWSNLFGGNDFEDGRHLQILDENHGNGFIFCGSSSSSLSGLVSDTTHGIEDIWIVKGDDYGLIEWNILLGGSNVDNARAIQSTSDGGFIVAGFSKSSQSGNVSQTNHGKEDIWIVKIDKLGAIIWDQLIGGNENEKVWDIKSTSEGGYILIGETQSSNNGDVSGFNQGSSDVWIVKLDSGGEIEWESVFGGTGLDIGTAIHQVADGGYIALATSDSPASGDLLSGSNGGTDFWAIRLDVSGNILWEKALGGSNNETALDMVASSDKGFVLTGFSNSSQTGDISGTNQGLNDAWIVKIDKLGNIVWEALFGGQGEDSANSLQPTQDGGYVVVGNSSSSANGCVTQTNHGGIDLWLFKVNALGEKLE